MSTELASRFKEGRALYVLIPLLVLHLILLSIQIEDPSGTFLFRRWVLQASAPFLNLSAVVSRGLTSMWSNYVSLRGAREENQQLRERVRQWSLRGRTFSQIESENARLRSLLAFKEGLQTESLGARVVGRAPDFMANIAYVDLGSRDGVRVNQAVLGMNGVMGRIVLVSSHNSQVQLITNADAAVGAMIERTRTPGVLMGSGDSILELNYISNTEHVEIDDLVVTSGLDGIFPKGLPLGRVVESDKGKSVFRHVRVRPLADLLHTEEVLVLTGPGEALESMDLPGDAPKSTLGRKP